jgi:hypothetical protein
MNEEGLKNNQLVSNIGLFYVCYELSKRGWNCLPTTRNARGVDLVIYSQDGKKKHTIQVKALSKKSAVPFGAKPNLMAEFVIICSNLVNNPEIFVLKSDEVKLVQQEKKNRISNWFSRKNYEKFHDRWDKIR